MQIKFKEIKEFKSIIDSKNKNENFKNSNQSKSKKIQEFKTLVIENLRIQR